MTGGTGGLAVDDMELVELETSSAKMLVRL